MPYATAADMQAVYPHEELVQRTNLDDPTATDINLDVLGRALQDGADEIDGYLGAYSLPFADPPPLLNRLNRVIARKNLYLDAPASERMPQWRMEYDDAIRTLRGISSGDITLGTPATAPHPRVVRVNARTRVFTRDRLSGM